MKGFKIVVLFCLKFSKIKKLSKFSKVSGTLLTRFVCMYVSHTCLVSFG